MNKTIPLIALSCLFLFSGCGGVLPAKTNIDVPFTSQAPAGNWSEPWQNACEETSIYMISSFYENDPIKRDEAIKKIREILKVKNETFKVSQDESLQTIADLIKTLGLPWVAELHLDPTAEELKAELANTRPIIVPVFAPSLRSATYSGGGPDYHVMVLTGYDEKAGVFIVNDPGSASGKGLRFPVKTVMNAIHDLDSKNYKAGQKAVLYTHMEGWQTFFGL